MQNIWILYAFRYLQYLSVTWLGSHIQFSHIPLQVSIFLLETLIYRSMIHRYFLSCQQPAFLFHFHDVCFHIILNLSIFGLVWHFCLFFVLIWASGRYSCNSILACFCLVCPTWRLAQKCPERTNLSPLTTTTTQTHIVSRYLFQNFYHNSSSFWLYCECWLPHYSLC